MFKLTNKNLKRLQEISYKEFEGRFVAIDGGPEYIDNEMPVNIQQGIRSLASYLLKEYEREQI